MDAKLEVEDEPEESATLVKSLVFGGLDGIITTFAIVATVAGARAHAGLVLVIGVANLIADGISMGVGDYLSERAEDEYVEHEARICRHEWRSSPEKCGARLARAYVKAGLSTEAANSVVDALSSRSEVAAAHSLLVHENLVAPESWKTDHALTPRVGRKHRSASPAALSAAAKKGLTTFAAFVLFGTAPLAAYYVTVSFVSDPAAMFTASCLVTTTTLVALGAAKARLTKQPVVQSALGMVVNGGAAALAAFVIGRYFEEHVAPSPDGPSPAFAGSDPPSRDRGFSGAGFAALRTAIAGIAGSLFSSSSSGAGGGGGLDTHRAAESDAAVSTLRVFFETCVAAGFAGVGAAPCFFMPKVAPRVMAVTNACAGGAVAAVAIALAVDAAADGKLAAFCGCGLGLGAVVLAKLATGGGDDDDDHNFTGHPVPSNDSPGQKKSTSPVVAVALASHSLAEGLALGAAYSNSAAKGRTACLSILIHNVPEGLATAAVVVGRGESPLTALVFALGSVAPQPLAAVLASHFASLFTEFANLFVAFAASMMFWIALSELIPDAFKQGLPSDHPNLAILAAASGLAVALSVA